MYEQFLNIMQCQQNNHDDDEEELDLSDDECIEGDIYSNWMKTYSNQIEITRFEWKNLRRILDPIFANRYIIKCCISFFREYTLPQQSILMRYN